MRRAGTCIVTRRVANSLITAVQPHFECCDTPTIVLACCDVTLYGVIADTCSGLSISLHDHVYVGRRGALCNSSVLALVLERNLNRLIEWVGCDSCPLVCHLQTNQISLFFLEPVREERHVVCLIR